MSRVRLKVVRHVYPQQYSMLNTHNHLAIEAAIKETLCSGETHPAVFCAEYTGPISQEGSP